MCRCLCCAFPCATTVSPPAISAAGRAMRPHVGVSIGVATGKAADVDGIVGINAVYRHWPLYQAISATIQGTAIRVAKNNSTLFAATTISTGRAKKHPKNMFSKEGATPSNALSKIPREISDQKKDRQESRRFGNKSGKPSDTTVVMTVTDISWLDDAVRRV